MSPLRTLNTTAQRSAWRTGRRPSQTENHASLRPRNKAPREVDDRKLKEHQPQTARQEKARHLRHRFATAGGEVCSGPRQKGEHRRAEVRNHAGQEERPGRVRQIFRRGALISEEIPNVVQHHEDHDGSTQHIHRGQALCRCWNKGRFPADGRNGRVAVTMRDRSWGQSMLCSWFYRKD
jgi:hypothetical protein